LQAPKILRYDWLKLCWQKFLYYKIMYKKQLQKITALAFATLLILPAITTSINTHASVNSKMVIAKSGLNFRDQDCKKMGVLKYGAKVTQGTITKNCTINGKVVKMTSITNADNKAGYVAESWLGAVVETKSMTTPVRTANVLKKANFDQNKSYTVNTTSGLWLRDMNGKIMKKVPYKTVLQSFNSCFKGSGVGVPPLVTSKGKTYELNYVCYNGQPMLTAGYLLK
jgi:hypothetical protein